MGVFDNWENQEGTATPVAPRQQTENAGVFDDWEVSEQSTAVQPTEQTGGVFDEGFESTKTDSI